MAANRHLAERFAQSLTDHDLEGFAALLHPDYVNHNRYAPPGKDGAVGIFRAFLDAFEGFRVDADDVLEAGDSWSGATPTAAVTQASSSASRPAGRRSRCTRSTSGGSRTAN